jgi:hypothetical protein
MPARAIDPAGLQTTKHKRNAVCSLADLDDDVQNGIVERDRICVKLITSQRQLRKTTIRARAFRISSACARALLCGSFAAHRDCAAATESGASMKPEYSGARTSGQAL